MKIPLTVLLPLLLLACARPPKEHPAGSASATSGTPATSALAPLPPPGAARPVPGIGAPTAAAATPEPSPNPSAAPTRSAAYFGCGEPIPPEHLWDETTEGEVLDAIGNAKTCAAQHGRRLLLEFVAPWCDDCREMAKLDETTVVAATLKNRFERVRINVGKWDRHETLRNNFDVRALATYIVIDPKSSKLIAKTTLEPITKKGQKLTAEQWARWLQAH